MKLLRCHVENFGKLEDFEMEFSEGINGCFRENGWGKSTLASFLKVMFYGFGNEKKRNQSEREREKFKPWQGGIYGGSLEFEIENKQYRMERSFGEREKEDTFVLYDIQTGLPSVMYSKEIGREIFRLDEESFLKSIYVSGLDCSTTATDSINAKLGNITDAMYDLEHYTKAMRILQQEMNRLTPKRKTGLLARQEEEMFVYQDQLVEADDRVELIEKKKKQMEVLKEQREDVLTLQSEIQKNILLYGKQQEQQSKHMIYQELCAQLEEKEIEIENCEDMFGMGVPERDELVKTLAIVDQQSLLEAVVEQCTLSVEEAGVLNQIENDWSNIPTEEELERQKSNIELSQQVLPEEEIEQEAEEEEEEVLPKRTRRNPLLSSLLWLALSISVLGIVVCYLQPFTGLFIFTIGIVCGLIADKRNSEWIVEEETVQIPVRKKNKHLEKEVLEGEISAAKEAAEKFVAEYPILEAQNATDHLNRMQIMLAQYTNLQGRRSHLQEKLEEKEQNELALAGFFQKYGLNVEDDKKKKLQNLLSTLDRYHGLLEEYERLQKRKSEYEEAHVVEDWAQAGDNSIVSIEQLHEQLDENLQEEKQLQTRIFALQTEIEEQENYIEKDMERKQQVHSLRDAIDKNQKKYQMVETARNYLQAAKEQFVARYRNPLSKSFSKYSSVILEENEDFLVDANMDVRKKELGMYRNSQSLSSGWQDLISICLRFALVDAMYTKEKPFLILDDPFINLDNDKMQGAFKLLQQIEKEYQVIYFSCHDSRMVEDTMDGFEKKARENGHNEATRDWDEASLVWGEQMELERMEA